MRHLVLVINRHGSDPYVEVSSASAEDEHDNDLDAGDMVSSKQRSSSPDILPEGAIVDHYEPSKNVVESATFPQTSSTTPTTLWPRWPLRRRPRARMRPTRRWRTWPSTTPSLRSDSSSPPRGTTGTRPAAEQEKDSSASSRPGEQRWRSRRRRPPRPFRLGGHSRARKCSKAPTKVYEKVGLCGCVIPQPCRFSP